MTRVLRLTIASAGSETCCVTHLEMLARLLFGAVSLSKDLGSLETCSPIDQTWRFPHRSLTNLPQL